MAHPITMQGHGESLSHEHAPTFFERLSRVFWAAQNRRAEKTVAKFIARNGGELTDDLEREISRRYGHMVE